uniref:valine--tRNA ligase n=1 Tax=Elaeophora elaphi TaxID=1147741 RepID=A0A0R3RW49_9BILA
MIYPRNICKIYLSKYPFCSGKHVSLQNNKRDTSFNIDVVIKTYEKWMERAAAIQTKDSDPNVYRMILPPPNVTGNLHIGHALTATIEDVMCRYRRLQGQQVVWYPGFDHAGIATQVVVERKLWNEKKLRRHQVTQHDFLQLCQQWKNERMADISKQLKALGATLDWQNTYYTLDDKFSEGVTIAFCQLYNDGLIFNDLRMVNWCPTLRSTISDQEVDIIDVGKNDFSLDKSDLERKCIEIGVMHRIRYEFSNVNSLSGSDYLEVGTTRPETLFADCALAVNPNDERYAKYIGLRVRHPLFPDRTLPILADAAVHADKGTGVLKITPAHDFIDFAIARNHADQLSDEDFNRSCIDESGCLINAMDFNGMDRFEARNKIVARLLACDKYGGSMPYDEQQLRICNRTGDIIEPMVKKQWFMDCASMNDAALRAIERGSLTVTPKYMQKHLENWLNEKEPWCLSRQLDWGQRIPAFRLDFDSDWIVAPNKAEALRLCDRTSTEMNLKQDADVLDTWFCSSLIPIILLGWPRKRIDRIPLSVLETGYDIVGFWVARMVTVCHSLTGYLPFPKVVLHGLVRDENGKKMSKSLGNVIDPSDIVNGISVQQMLERLDRSALSETEKKVAADSLKSRFPEGIPRCGPDALRFALLRHDVGAMDINIDVVRTAVEGLKFCNKLWNLCIYTNEILRNYREVSNQVCDDRIEDCWIKSRLESSLMIMSEKIESDCPHLALTALHRFLYNDLCDVYIETTKKALRSKDYPRLRVVAAVLHDVIEKSLIHLSIFMPFVSQHLLDRIKREKESSTCVTSPKMDLKPCLIDKKLEEDMSFVLEVIKAIRSIRAQFRISAKNTLQVACYGENCDLKSFQCIIQELCNVTLSSTVADEHSNCSLPFPVSGYSAEIYVTIGSDYGSLVKKELLRRIQKAEKRKGQFLHQIDKHEKLAKSATRDDLVERHQRKISQANAIVNGGVCVLHVIMAPYTKVEESFNVQAIHDILYHQLDFIKYDHHEFPGVVPRTFVGAMVVSAPFFPVVMYFKWSNIAKHWILYCVRLVLGFTILFAFGHFAKQIDKKFGKLSADFLRLIVATQFHFMFYCSRPLPNTFALLGGWSFPSFHVILCILWTYQKILDGRWLCATRIATVFTLLFRCELILLYGCIFVWPVLVGQLSLFGWNGAIVHCLSTALLTLGITVPIDSFLWRRWVWPEGEVWWFNIILNKSHEYGVLPYFWYFYSAIPRALIASTALVPLGALIDVFLFFIWTNRWKSMFRMLMAVGVILHLVVNVVGTFFFLLASSRNYPGGEALTSLQYLRHSSRDEPITVYIDNYAAQTGISRFLQWYGAWEYNKTENLEQSQLSRFDYLLIGSYTEPDIVDFIARNFSSTHHVLYDVKAFQGIKLVKMQQFPYYWPTIRFNAQLAVLEKLRYSDSI